MFHRSAILIACSLVALCSPTFSHAISCEDLTYGFQNPTDPSIGKAWPLQGVALQKTRKIQSPDGKTYILFRLLKEDTGESNAYLALDEMKKPFVIKEYKQYDLASAQDRNQLDKIHAYIQKHELKTAGVGKTFWFQNKFYGIQNYIPGMNGDDFTLKILSKEIILDSRIVLEIAEKLETIHERAAALENTVEFEAFAKSINLIIGLDTSIENFVYFDGDWVWVDP